MSASLFVDKKKQDETYIVNKQADDQRFFIKTQEDNNRFFETQRQQNEDFQKKQTELQQQWEREQAAKNGTAAPLNGDANSIMALAGAIYSVATLDVIMNTLENKPEYQSKLLLSGILPPGIAQKILEKIEEKKEAKQEEELKNATLITYNSTEPPSKAEKNAIVKMLEEAAKKQEMRNKYCKSFMPFWGPYGGLFAAAHYVQQKQQIQEQLQQTVAGYNGVLSPETQQAMQKKAEENIKNIPLVLKPEVYEEEKKKAINDAAVSTVGQGNMISAPMQQQTNYWSPPVPKAPGQ